MLVNNEYIFLSIQYLILVESILAARFKQAVLVWPWYNSHYQQQEAYGMFQSITTTELCQTCVHCELVNWQLMIQSN